MEQLGPMWGPGLDPTLGEKTALIDTIWNIGCQLEKCIDGNFLDFHNGTLVM